MWQPLYEAPFVLPPKHAAIFRRTAAILSDNVGWEDWEDHWDALGIAVFDNLTQHQKQVAILTVARALLDPNSEAPEVTAVLAGTVDMIYINLQIDVEMEIDRGDTKARRMILEALDEMNYWNEVNASMPPDEEPELRPSPSIEDISTWSFYVDVLREEILDDYDHSMQAKFMDLPPDFADKLKSELDIDPDYFVGTVEDPAPAVLARVREGIKSLLYLASDDDED